MPVRQEPQDFGCGGADAAHAVKLDDCVERKDRAAGFLAFCAVAGVAEKGSAFELVPDLAAVAAASDHGEGARGRHFMGCLESYGICLRGR